MFTKKNDGDKSRLNVIIPALLLDIRIFDHIQLTTTDAVANFAQEIGLAQVYCKPEQIYEQARYYALPVYKLYDQPKVVKIRLRSKSYGITQEVRRFNRYISPVFGTDFAEEIPVEDKSYQAMLMPALGNALSYLPRQKNFRAFSQEHGIKLCAELVTNSGVLIEKHKATHKDLLFPSSLNNIVYSPEKDRLVLIDAKTISPVSTNREKSIFLKNIEHACDWVMWNLVM